MDRVVVLGAGPTGCEAALAFADAGSAVTLVEQGPRVGHHLRCWAHVRLFTPWAMNISPRTRELLPGLPDDPTRCPTGADLADTLLEAQAAAVVARGGTVLTGTRVVAVGRDGLVKSDEIGTGARAGRQFRVLVDGPDGERLLAADLVVDATGTWGRPNLIGDGGIPAPGERALAGRLRRGIPTPAEVASMSGREVLLLGAGYSAQTAARDLGEAGAAVIWAVRSAAPSWQPAPDDPLPARAALASSASQALAGRVDGVVVVGGVVVDALAESGGRLAVTLRETATGDRRTVEVDEVVGLVGSTGDHDLLRQLQVHECYATAAPMNLSAALLSETGGDCLAQVSHGVDTLRSPEPDLFVLGSKSYGRNNTYLLRVGWEQVDAVLAAVVAGGREPVRA